MNVFQILKGVFIATVFLILVACEPNETPTTTAPKTTEVVKPEPKLDDGEKEIVYDPERYVWQRPNLIISLLGNGDLSEKTVVDIGAGAGFFSERLAPLAKKVIALDIDQNFLNIIDSIKLNELPANIQSRLETRLTPRDAPNLEKNEVDAVLIVNTFMFIDNKLDYLNKLKKTVKPGGRIVIVDFKRKRTDLGPLPREHRLPLFEVEDLFYKAGYKNIQAIDTELKYQYILVAER